MYNRHLVYIIPLVISLSLHAQNAANLQAKPNFFEDKKNFVVQIGWVNNGKFQTDGAGLSTYTLVNNQIIVCIITAGHIIDDFLSRGFDSFYVRFSWADSIKTTSYFGTAIPLKVGRTLPLYFKPSNSSIDLGCIILPDVDSIAQNYYNLTNHGSGHVFPVRLINDPAIGQETAMFGYPQNIENVFNSFNYSICTIKPGLISWVPHGKIDPQIDSYILVETNSTYGNSGGPVFVIPNLFTDTTSLLVGITSGIINEPTIQTLMLNGKVVKDTASNNPYYVQSLTKTGVAVIIRSNVVRDFLNEIKTYLQSHAQTYGFATKAN